MEGFEDLDTLEDDGLRAFRRLADQDGLKVSRDCFSRVIAELAHKEG
jgi:hypothetical protein